MSLTLHGQNGEVETVEVAAKHAIGSDEHRIELARWAIDTFPAESALHKKAIKVLEAYLAGKPLPKA